MKLQRLFVAIGLAAVLAGLALPASAQNTNRPPRPPRPPAQTEAPFRLFGPGVSIGVGVHDVDSSEAARQKMSGGAVVDMVRADSPAGKAGIRTADVIVEFDGERVRSARQLSRLVQETPSGRTVKAIVVRDGQRVDVSLTPEGDQRGAGGFIDRDRLRDEGDRLRDEIGRLGDGLFNLEVPGPRGRLGVTVQELTPELATYFGVKEGVLVSSVASDMPAARAGVKAGDVITAIDGHAVGTRQDLVRAIAEAREGQSLTVGTVRDKKPMTLTVQLPRDVRGRSL